MRDYALCLRDFSRLRDLALRPALAVALFTVYSSPGSAFTVTAQQRAACEPDVYRLCADDIPNVSKIIACVRREKANLSPACREVVDAAEQQYASRSIAPPESIWCQFTPAAQIPSEAVWLKWCGPDAQ